MHEGWPIRGVPIPNEVSRGLVPRESLGDLARDPLRSRVFRHAKRQPNSSSMPYDDKTIKHPERDRWKDKKVDRRNGHPHDCAETSSSLETVATCCGTYI